MMHDPSRPRPQVPSGPGHSGPGAHTLTAKAPAPAVPGAAGPDARQFAASLVELMDAFLATIEEETECVGKGKLAAAGAVGARKGELAGRYLAATQRLKAHAPAWRAAEPELFAELQRRHDAFRGRLQVNLTVLATAHAVAEGLIRGAAGELARRNAPQGYGAGGQATKIPPRTAQPVAFSQTF